MNNTVDIPCYTYIDFVKFEKRLGILEQKMNEVNKLYNLHNHDYTIIMTLITILYIIVIAYIIYSSLLKPIFN